MVNKLSNLVHRIHSILIKMHTSWSTISTSLNTDVEAQMQNCDDRNINEVLRILFDWCDSLNARVDNEKPWQDSRAALSIAAEVKSIIPYFACICPEIERKFENEMFPIFRPLKFID